MGGNPPPTTNQPKAQAMNNAEQLLAFFEHAPLTVALGQMIAQANEAGDDTIKGFLLEELADAVETVKHLNNCYALEAN